RACELATRKVVPDNDKAVKVTSALPDPGVSPFQKLRRGTRRQPLLPPEEMRRAQLAFPAKRGHTPPPLGSQPLPLLTCLPASLSLPHRACLLSRRPQCYTPPHTGRMHIRYHSPLFSYSGVHRARK